MSTQYINIKTIHIISWSCYLSLLIVFFSSIFNFEIAFYKAIQLATLHIFLFYLNTLVLMPKLMEKGKYKLYFSSLILLIAAAIGTLYLLDSYVKPFCDILPNMRGIGRDNMTDFIERPFRKEQIRPVIFTRGITRNFLSITIIILLSIVYRMFFQKLSEEKRKTVLRNEHLICEMKFLKSQVNPHFLFNALNNIYTLVHLKQDRAPAMLMRLSEMLRYMLYECNDEWVPLEKEILYINNYIELQQLKTKQTQNITTDFKGVDEQTLIPPFLLIPFIENSFKHSRIENIKTGWVSMHLHSSDEHIQFKIVNSIPSVPISKDETGGIGLENARRRLELLYPGKHELFTGQTDKEFMVNLNISY